MPPPKRLPIKRVAQIRHYTPPPVKRIPTGYREAFVHGVPYGIVHLVPIHGAEESQNETLCSNRAGKTPAPGADQRRCPVCWKDQP